MTFVPKTFFLLLLQFFTYLGVNDGVERKSYRKGEVGVSFGISCSADTSQWAKTVNDHLPSKPIYGCQKSGCGIAANYDGQYDVEETASSITLKLIPRVNSAHAGLYSCETNPFDQNNNIVENFDVTVYDNLICYDNVTQHKAGETIKLECAVNSWGNGVPDLQFQLLDEKIEVIVNEIRDEKKIIVYLKLEKTHHGKQLACVFKGFNGVASIDEQKCIINDGALNVLFPPEIVKGPDGKKFAKKGDDEFLDCVTDGNPKPYTTFYKNGNVEIDGASLLTLDMDVTEVSCKAVNNLGTDTTTMEINVLSFESRFSPTMTEKQQYQFECTLRKSIEDFGNLKISQFIGEEEIPTNSVSVLAKKEWNRKKIKCITKDEDSHFEYVFVSDEVLNVLFGPEITCMDQAHTSDRFERICTVHQNPLPSTFQGSTQVTIRTDFDIEYEHEWSKEENFRKNLTLSIKKSSLKEPKKAIFTITVSGIKKEIDIIYEDDVTPAYSSGFIHTGLIAGVTVGVVVLGLIISIGYVAKMARPQTRQIDGPIATNSSSNFVRRGSEASSHEYAYPEWPASSHVYAYPEWSGEINSVAVVESAESTATLNNVDANLHIVDTNLDDVEAYRVSDPAPLQVGQTKAFERQLYGLDN